MKPHRGVGREAERVNAILHQQGGHAFRTWVIRTDGNEFVGLISEFGKLSFEGRLAAVMVEVICINVRD